MRLPHGYTNDTLREDGTVTKKYRGVDSLVRLTREVQALHTLANRIPVVKVRGVDTEELTIQTTYIAARHGQELLDEGHAQQVLFLCGQVLRLLQGLSPHLLPDIPGTGTVIVHGDFGPQNMLIEPTNWELAALLDWEWVHLGEPTEDIAWCEWIVRMHHPTILTSLPALFQGYGMTPSWELRHRAMMLQCQRLLEWVYNQPDPAARLLWKARLRTTEQFVGA